MSFPANWCNGDLYFYNGQYSSAYKAWKRLYELYPESPYSQFVYSLILVYNNKTDESIPIIDYNAKSNPGTVFSKLGLILKYALQGYKKKVLNEITQDFKKTVLHDYSYSHHLSSFLSLTNQKKDALDWLENAINSGLINYSFLAEKDPFMENIRSEERFKKLMKRVKHEWENFEV